MQRDERSPAAIGRAIPASRRPAYRRSALRRMWPAALLLLTACAQEPAPRIVDEIRSRGELRVVTVNSPTAYYLGRDSRRWGC